MAKKYAAGTSAWGECARCGRRDLLRALVFDGQYPNLRVCNDCYEPKHPQENLKRIDDPVALWRPAPENLPSATAPVLTALADHDEVTVALSWTESLSGVSQVDTYLLYRSVDGGSTELLYTLPIERDMFGGRTTELEYLDEDVAFGHFYDYSVIGRPLQGGDSPRSNIERVTFFFDVLPVLSGSATEALTGSQLSWTAAHGLYSIAGYRLYRADTDELVIDTGSLNYTETPLPAGTYSYYVVAYDVQGNVSDHSNEVSILVPIEVISEVFSVVGAFQWNKRPFLKQIVVTAIAGGGGGEGGSTVVPDGFGGGGGGGGEKRVMTILAASLPASVAVVVGNGGAGGAGSPANTSSRGSPGATGQDSVFTGFVVAKAGAGGGLGGGRLPGNDVGNPGGTGGTGGTGYPGKKGGAGGIFSTPASTAESSDSNGAPAGGGGGGGAPFNFTSSAGGNGSTAESPTPAGGTAGPYASAGGDGESSAQYDGGAGGGGGGGAAAATATGGDGGDAGRYGAGGGGGGCAGAGGGFVQYPGGPGGNGAQGVVRVVNTIDLRG